MDYENKMKDYQKEYSEKHKRVSLSISMNEYKKLETLAKKEKTKPTSFATALLLSYINNEPLIPHKLEQDLQALSKYIRNIANNVNEMAHYSHQLREMRDEQNLLLELQKLEQSVKQFTLRTYEKKNNDN